MHGPTAFATLILITTGQIPANPAQDPKKLLAARYENYNKAIAKNDAKALSEWAERWLTPSFTYTSKDKNVYKKDAFIKGLKEQASFVAKPLSSKLLVTKVDATDSKLVATVVSEYEAMVKFDKAKLRLVDKSTTSDTWVRVGGDWKLERSVQLKADTQMFSK